MTEGKKDADRETSRKQVLKKAVDPKDKRNRDDALSLAELAAEELTGLGVAKRLFGRIRRIVGREFIARIDEQTEEINQLEDTVKFLENNCVRLLATLDERDEKIAELEAALKDKNGDGDE